MTTNFISRPPEMAGVYLTDHNTVAPTHKGQNFWLPEGNRFLPILNLMQFNARAELRLADVDNVSNDIETYNAKTNPYSLNQRIISHNRLNVSMGDLLIGGVRVVLNFMEYPVAIKTRSDIPKLFHPLSNAQMEEYKGKLIVMSFHSFNTPQSIKEVSGIANYFENLRTEKIQKGEAGTTPVRMLEYLSRCWQEFKPEHPQAIFSNSIKLGMVHEYTVSDFLRNGAECTELYCSESGLMLRRTSNVLEMASHPKLSDSMMANRQIVQSMRDNGIACFIVDNDKRVSERFINFAGQIRQIPQVFDKNRPEGLYITSVNGDKGLEADSFVSLDKIDESPYIFRSQEEARLGADIRQQTAQTHELSKLELGMEALELKHRYEEQIRQMDLDAKRRQAEADAHARQMELRYQEALRNIKVEGEGTKARTYQDKYRFEVLGMENKYRYETEKYERDTTIETMKTVGSIAGLMAGGYMIFKQLSK